MNAKEQATSSNFSFLGTRYPELERIGARSERYFSEDPIISLMTVRRFGEVLAQLVAAGSGLFTDAGEPQADLLRRLRVDSNYPRNVLDLFHQLRLAGNAAVHDHEGDHATALTCLKMARQLGIWFYRTFVDRNLKTGPFQPPCAPADATAELTAELNRLRAERDAALTETERAKAAAAEAEAARLSAETGAKGAAEERAIWEQLAADAETAKIKLTQQVKTLQAAAMRPEEAAQARLSIRPAPSPLEDLREAIHPAREEIQLARQLVGMQTEAAASSTAARQEVLQFAQRAAEAIDLDEADTRALIDQQLRERGWDPDTNNLRYANGTRPVRVSQWQLPNGPRITVPPTTPCSSARPASLSSKQSVGVRMFPPPLTKQGDTRRDLISSKMLICRRVVLGYLNREQLISRRSEYHSCLQQMGGPISNRSRHKAVFGFATHETQRTCGAR
jgi:type I restriction enzyme, R subunit